MPAQIIDIKIIRIEELFFFFFNKKFNNIFYPGRIRQMFLCVHRLCFASIVVKPFDFFTEGAESVIISN